jgi:hypothetical protein
MNLLNARFAMLMVMMVLIAVAAVGQRETLASTQADPEGAGSTACPTAVLVHVGDPSSPESTHRTPRRAIRWQSFLPGTFR